MDWLLHSATGPPIGTLNHQTPGSYKLHSHSNIYCYCAIGTSKTCNYVVAVATTLMLLNGATV
jgi:hypothetical protein